MPHLRCIINQVPIVGRVLTGDPVGKEAQIYNPDEAAFKNSQSKQLKTDPS